MNALPGFAACVDYLADLGRQCESISLALARAALLAAFEAIQAHERGLLRILIPGLLAIPGVEALWHQRCEAVRPAVSDDRGENQGTYSA